MFSLRFNTMLIFWSFVTNIYSFMYLKSSVQRLRTIRFSNVNQDEVSTLQNTIMIYFDISLENQPIGTLTFRLIQDPDACPTLRDNLIKICTGERKPIDPLCTYVGCSFKHSPNSVEGFPQYRWAHEVVGKKRNAVGRPTERITETSLRQCSHSIYGGVYYGLNYEQIKEPYGVVLIVPLAGPLRGSSSFSIVRVDESPKEWKERLLLNTAVLGTLVSGIETLHTMARQTRAPPIITASGKLLEAQ